MKLTRFALTLSAAAILAACGNLTPNITNEGTIEDVKDLVWPDIDDVRFNHDGTQVGSWPNWENVRIIERGMNKDQLYNLIGRPHFAEGLYGVREWDYLFHYRENGEHKWCQYKILFDKNMDAQSFFWYPNGCNGFGRFVLEGDFLFDFDKDTITARGHEVIKNVAQQIIDAESKTVHVAGFTDRLGSVSYNLDLSKRRAANVRTALQSYGVSAPITTEGLGKANQVKACEGEKGQALRDCLRPNRRVEISTTGPILKASESHEVGGTVGPQPYRERAWYQK